MSLPLLYEPEGPSIKGKGGLFTGDRLFPRQTYDGLGLTLIRQKLGGSGEFFNTSLEEILCREVVGEGEGGASVGVLEDPSTVEELIA